MKNRVLISFLIFSLFLGLSVSAQETREIRNVILMIGDGMGTSQVFAGMTAQNGDFHITTSRHIGFSKTQSGSHYVTDSAAGGTALSTGKKTYNGAIAVDMHGKRLKTILELAAENGYATGLVASSAITHATPASFIAHDTSRNNYEAIARDFLDTDVDVFIGGGKKHFAQRTDSVNLLEALEKKGYQMAYTLRQAKKVRKGKLAALLYDGHPPRVSEGRNDMLPKASKIAIKLLKENSKGFFLMIEGSQIDWGGHANDMDYILEETLDFDDAVGKVLKFAQKDGHTLVIVTADHETGGLGLNGYDPQNKKIDAGFTTGHHTGTMVPVFAFGPGAEMFQGVYENTEIFFKMKKALGL